MKPNNKFDSVFNPISRDLAVVYGGKLQRHTFTEIDEWVEIEHPKNKRLYLHIQFDYDERLQLLFYPRIAGDESLYEDMGVYHTTGEEESPQIVMVFTDAAFSDALKRIQP